MTKNILPRKQALSSRNRRPILKWPSSPNELSLLPFIPKWAGNFLEHWQDASDQLIAAGFRDVAGLAVAVECHRLTPADLPGPLRQTLFLSLLACHLEHVDPDEWIIIKLLEQMHYRPGDTVAIEEILHATGVGRLVEHHAAAVAECGRRYRAWKYSEQLLDPNVPIEEMLSDLIAIARGEKGTANG